MADEQTIPSAMNEADIPATWHDIEQEPINPANRPAGAPPQPNDMPPYFRAVLNPDMQHDTHFVGTSRVTPQIPVTPLMPPAISANPQNNANIQSIVKNTVITATDIDPYLHYRGVWSASIGYLVNDVVTFNGSLYAAIGASINLQPDNNHDSNPAEGSVIGNPVWTLLSENFVFSPNPPHLLTTGGFGPYDTGVIAQGSGTAVSITGAPSRVGEIALLTLVESNGGNSVASGLSGWTFITSRGNSWTYYYKILNNANPINVSATLSFSDNWIGSLDFFQFGGFASVSASQVTVNAANQITVLIGNSSNLIQAGQVVLFQNFVGASFLNGTTMTVSTANATQLTGTIAPGHANYGPTADSGTVTVILQGVGTETSGAEFPPVQFGNPSFTNSRVGDVFVATSVAGGIFAGSGQLTGYSDTNGNSYQSSFALNTSGGAHFTLNNGYSSPNKAAGTITISVGGGSDLTSAGWGAIELAGSASVPLYQPYDVIEFRGSVFVCLSETTNTAFQQPSAWGLLGPATGFAQVKTASYAAVQSDEGNLLTFNSSSAVTLTLPNPLFTINGLTDSGWWIAVENTGTGSLTISPNGLTLDGGGSLVLFQNQGCLIFTDGLNYFTVRAATSGSGFVGGVNSQTANYTAVFGDGGKLISMNGSNLTLTLPATPPNSIWMIYVENLNSTNLTVSPNGKNIDGSGSNLTLGQNQGIIIFTDGSNYFTTHGVNRLTVPTWLAASAPDGSGNVTITTPNQNANQVLASPASGGPGPLTVRPLVSADIPPLTPAQLPPLAVVEVQGTLVTHSVSGTLRLPGNIIPPAGVYQVNVYFDLAANPSAGTLDVAIGWNDTVLTRSATNGTLGAPADISTAALNVATGVITVVSDGIHDVTWAMTLT